jgi:AcrR family transcriptional regulator
VTETRAYVSPTREAKAAATREAILEAFVAQVHDGRDTLSPTEAAAAAGVSVRTVHTHFPNRASQIVALGEWFDRMFYPDGVVVARDADDLPRYYRDIHNNALKSPLTRTLAAITGSIWPEVRQARRRDRLDAIRAAVAGIGASKQATADATAMLLSLSGADACWPMHDLYGLPLERIPDVIAHTVRLIVEDLQRDATAPARAAPSRPATNTARATKRSRPRTNTRSKAT